MSANSLNMSPVSVPGQQTSLDYAFPLVMQCKTPGATLAAGADWNPVFFGLQAPERGGETPLCRSDIVFERLAQRCPKFARDCEEKGLRYSNVMPSDNDPKSGMGRSWKSTFRAETKGEAEARLREI